MNEPVTNVVKGLESLLVMIDKLNPDPENARKHNKRNLGAIKASLKNFGMHQPIVVQKQGMIVRVGNARLEAATALGWTHVAAVVVDENDVQAAARAIADNRTGDLAEWDFEQLDKVLEELHEAEVPMALVGFDKMDFPTVGMEPDGFGSWRQSGGGGDQPIHPDPPLEPDDEVEPTTRRGDLWILGEHRLLCGDSFEKEDRDRLLEGKRVDLVVTDPPYAIYGSSTGISSSIADDKMVRPFFERLGTAISGSLKHFGCAYMFTDWRSWAALWYGLSSAKLSPKNCIVWDKGDGGLGTCYAMTHEFIAFFMKLPEQKTMQSDNSGHGRIRQVLRPNTKRHNRVAGTTREHNAQKPVPLLTELIEEGSDAGEVVLDLFGGSGSTMIAAHEAGRTARLMELEPRWCDVIVARWERLTGEKAVLDDS